MPDVKIDERQISAGTIRMSADAFPLWLAINDLTTAINGLNITVRNKRW